MKYEAHLNCKNKFQSVSNIFNLNVVLEIIMNIYETSGTLIFPRDFVAAYLET